MDKINLNKILDRENIYNEIKDIILNFNNNKNNLIKKKGIYIYGPPGSGKSEFINNLLKDINYDVIQYNSSEIRNKSIIETINEQYLSNVNVISLFNKTKKPIAIIMDEIDSMNNGDKGGINSLIKLIRPKKTKKQKLEKSTHIPIICIGNYIVDKKIKELIKVTENYVFNLPTNTQMINIIQMLLPNYDIDIINNICNYIQNDLRKLNYIYNLLLKKSDILNNNSIFNLFLKKQYNEDTKDITKKIFHNNFSIKQHNSIINETDRTIIGLLWHENIINYFSNFHNKISINLYLSFLNNICFADNIDRITFQKQIWQFNEISSLIKIFYNNYIFHNSICKPKKICKNSIRFTKVLTKYSSEYNNLIFITTLCQNLNLDKKDLISFFYKNKTYFSINKIYQDLEYYEINKLDINRIYRYIDKLFIENNELKLNNDDSDDNDNDFYNEDI